MAKAPVNPLAGVPGPGPFSVRNDKLNLGSIAYSEGKETAMLNTAAPKSKTFGAADKDKLGGRPASLNLKTPVTPLFALSEKPNQNVLAGVDIGDDVGSSALMMKKSTVKTSDTLAPLLPFDTTGEIGILYQDALSRGN